MRILLTCIVADWIEGAKVSLVLQMPSKRPCHTCYCPLVDFSDYSRSVAAKLRTEKRSKIVISRGMEMAANRKKGERKKLSSRHSLNFRPNVFWDLPVFDVHQCLGPDCLHVLDIGLFEWIIKFIFAEFDGTMTTAEASKTKEEVTNRLAGIPYFPGLVRFPNGIEKVAIDKKGKFQGAEYRDIMKQIVAVVVDLVSPATLRALTAFLELYRVAKLPKHDQETLKALRDITSNFFSAMGHFTEYSASELRFPKLHVTAHFERFIKAFGRLENLDTETFETFHHAAAQIPYDHTNKQRELVTKQVPPLFSRNPSLKRGLLNEYSHFPLRWPGLWRRMTMRCFSSGFLLRTTRRRRTPVLTFPFLVC